MLTRVRLVLLVLLGALILAALPAPAALGGATGPVHVVRVHGTIDRGLARTVARAVRQAQEAHADLLVLEISTLGGRVDAALEIRDAVLASPVPTLALVKDRAWSAGALIALSADTLLVQPGSSLGAAQPIPADEKTVSALRTEFETTAERKGRDPRLAAAMVDAAVVIEDVIERDRLLTLTAGRAVELGLADGMARDLQEALELQGLGGARLVIVRPTPGEALARLVTDPVVTGLLLTFGVIGVVAELLTPGFGLPGTVGLVCLALFVGGHLLAGVGGWEAAALFVLGLGLLGIEALLPGFGVFGIGGIISLLGSVYLFTGGGPSALTAMSIALVVTVGGGMLVFRFASRRGLLDRLTLPLRLGREEGYLARIEPSELLDQEGTAVTPFRPAGIAEVGGRRVDAVSEGGFIAAGTTVQVVGVEGARVVVRQIEGR
ncbi:MAG: NfeD family protein [bacterium]|nr:NfeD family protein [bacterium]